jgi:hypothetical protein
VAAVAAAAAATAATAAMSDKGKYLIELCIYIDLSHGKTMQRKHHPFMVCHQLRQSFGMDICNSVSVSTHFRHIHSAMLTYLDNLAL